MKAPVMLQQNVYNKIKQLIAFRQLPPGSRLVIRSLAKQLNTSTMPVQEAISQLEHDGLVTRVPKWGAYVKEWTYQERLDAYHIRRALEGEAARLFVMRASPENKEILVQLSDKFDALAPKDPVACDEADIAFHLHIARSTRCQRLAQLIETSKVETATIFATFVDENLKDYRLKVGTHGRLVQELLGENPDTAMQEMWKHIDLFMNLVKEKSVVEEATQIKHHPLSRFLAPN